MKKLVIGMTAHVDSGKTTLSEAMLFVGGELRRAGRVDKGDAFLDTHHIERSRGITVFAKQAVLHRESGIYTLLDTPGHADFSAETERAFRVLDYAVLVISGTDGVQSHTETLWRMLERYKIPLFIFVNKMDISELGREYILAELKSRLSSAVTDFTPARSREAFFEETALCDEELMDMYLDSGGIPDDIIAAKISGRKIFPCCFGSALKFTGVEEFLSVIEKYALFPDYPDEFGARVYKITQDNGERLTHMKITGGAIRVRDLMENGEKINRIRIYSGAKFTSPDTAEAGTLCAVTGLSGTRAGEGLGFEKNASAPMSEPVLDYKVIFPESIDDHTMLSYLRQLEEEDPQLHITVNERYKEIHARLMGKIQTEILQTLVKERFGIDISFGKGSISYRETIAAPVEGIGHYEPLRHYAEVRLLMEPSERGNGLSFDTDCPEEILGRNFQRLVLTHLEEKVHLGVLTGSPITDMKITLVAGRSHLKHTEGGDFRQAVYRAVRMGLMSAESVLLEPWYDFTLEIPSECVGRAIYDLERMNGEVAAPETVGDMTVIKGSAPVSLMADYHNDVAEYSHGKGRLSCIVKGYYPCHNTDDVIAEKGYDPEADLDNPADSVFCGHGAGYAVKWSEVPAYAHTGSVLGQGNNSRNGSPEEITPAEIARYKARLYDDDELMAIFERTYGKINRDKRQAMRRVPETVKYKAKSAKPFPTGPEYLLVDGYNIIFSWDELKELAKDSLENARLRLIDILCNYRGFKQCNLILVFDAYKVKGNHGEIEQVNGISVVYTKEAETADMYIEKTSHKLSGEHRVRVATSDGTEQLIILGNGAYRVPSSEFYEEVKAVEKAIRDIIEKPKLEKPVIRAIKDNTDKNG